MVNLDELAKKAQEAQEAYEKALKDSHKAVLEEIVAKIKQYKITATELAKACGFEPPAELKKRVPVKATPKYTYTLDGEVHHWAGRGKNPPKELVKFLELKKITVKQFKDDKQYAYKG